MDKPFIKSRAKAVLFLLLPNDWAWAILSHEQKQYILEKNLHHNTTRPDYADPEKYCGGQGYDSIGDRNEKIEGKWLNRFLAAHNPASVIEYGPGSGFRTRTIVEYPSVKRYIAVDINQPFLDYIGDRLKTLKCAKEGFDYDLKCCNFWEVQEKNLDACFFISSLHHIPNRLELFSAVFSQLRPGGKIICLEPSHYIPRCKRLIKKIRTIGWLDKVRSGESAGTHHFLTMGEYKRITHAVSGLKIVDYDFFGGGKSFLVRAITKIASILGLGEKNYLRRSFFHKLFSQWIMVTLEKTD